MKRLLNILPILALLIASCNREPYADGFVEPSQNYVGMPFKFTDLSSNTDYVEWDFDDGTPISSDYISYHSFIDPGFYDVTLRAFGTKGGVSSTSFTVEVWGAELKIIVQLWTPEGQPEGYLVPGASVILYPTKEDWINQTNPVEQVENGVIVEDLITDRNGEVYFTDLSYHEYYVDVWEQNHDNYQLQADGWIWVETQIPDMNYNQVFVAYVDYYADGKKSTARTSDRPSVRDQKTSGENRVPGEIRISEPRKK